ncbi:hypothetical protein Q8X39_19595 [Leptothrix discophora]|uniref:Uncharacterized protein n=2 Tax=Leptothrix discophora TaxID=89 RepID=A0ABT9G8N4_LEPDI|nr:hypothetical protein [Leptothrix discophora]
MKHLLVALGGVGAEALVALESRRTAGNGASKAQVACCIEAAGPDRHGDAGWLGLQAGIDELKALMQARPDLRRTWDRDGALTSWIEPMQAAWQQATRMPQAWQPGGRAIWRHTLAARHGEVLALLQRAIDLAGQDAGPGADDPSGSTTPCGSVDPSRPAWICHVVAGLGDAVAAGLLVDVLALLRLHLPPGTPLHLHATLPDGDDTGAQAQAATVLQELQALADGRPWPETLAGGDASGVLAGLPAFDRCWLSSPVDETGRARPADVAPAEPLAGLLELLLRQPDAVLAPGGWQAETPIPTRARFVAWGQAQVRCDVAGIARHLGHELLLRLAHQLRYDHWRPALGYVASASLVEREARLQDEQLADWGLSPEHLSLAAGMAEIEAADEPPGSVEQDWQALTVHALGLLELADPAERLVQLPRLMAEAERSRFRGVGIAAAFRPDEATLQRRAVAVRQRVERALWLDWRDGKRSLHGGGQLLSLVLAHVRQAAQTFGEQRQGREEQAAQRDAALQAQLPAASTGLWSRLARPRRSVAELEALAYLMRDAALARTQALRLDAARRFCDQLETQFTVLQDLVDACEMSLGALAQTADRDASASLPPASPAAPADVRAGIDDMPALQPGQRLETRELLALHRGRLVTDPAVLREHLAEIRPAAFQGWGDRPGFRTLAAWLEASDSQSALLALCHARLPAAALQEIADDGWRAIGRRWAAQPARRERDLRALRAGCAVWLTPQPESEEGLGQVTSPDPLAGTHWLWPQALVDGLLRPVRPADGGAADAAASEASPSDVAAPTEAMPAAALAELLPMPGDALRVDAGSALLAWRVQPIARLDRWRQVQALQQSREGLHRQLGSALRPLQLDVRVAAPDLVAPGEARLRERTRAALLLADALGVVEWVASSSGAQLVHVRRDGDGFELSRSVLGDSLAAAAQGHAGLILGPLFDRVLDTLQATAPDAAAIDRIRCVVQQRVDAADARAADPASTSPTEPPRAWHDAARTAMKILRQDPTA